MRQGLGDKTYGLPNERYYMLHKFYRFLALNIILYILVIVYYGFYETTFFYYMYIFKIGKTINEKKKLLVFLFHFFGE